MNIKALAMAGLAASTCLRRESSSLMRQTEKSVCQYLDVNLPKQGWNLDFESSVPPPEHMSQAWRNGNWDVIATSSQTQTSSYPSDDMTKASKGILNVLEHPDITNFGDASLVVASAMRQKYPNEVMVSSFSSRQGNACPAVWNKQDNDNPKIKRIALFLNDAEFTASTWEKIKRLKQVFNLKSKNIIHSDTANGNTLPTYLKLIGETVQNAQEQGFQTEVLIGTDAHGVSAFRNYPVAQEVKDATAAMESVFESEKQHLGMQERVATLKAKWEQFLNHQWYDKPINETRENELEQAWLDARRELIKKENKVNQVYLQKKADMIRRIPEGEAEGSILLNGDQITKTKLQELMDQFLPQNTRGLVWIDACHSGGFLNLDAGRLGYPKRQFQIKKAKKFDARG